MVDHSELDFATRAIHAGYDAMTEQGALTPPIHMTSTFCFDSVEQGAARFTGEASGYVYSRLSNPTVAILEQRLASLEGAEAAVATASGMGAISSALWTLLSPGDQVLADKTLYGCTFSLLEHGLRKFGIEVVYADFTQLDAVAAAITKATRVVYFETPANPNMRLVDIKALSEAVRSRSENARIIVDNTYCTPALQQPLALGADLVVHSATKYLGGHGDLIAGVIAGSQQDMDDIRGFGLKDMTGAVMSPMTAFLVMRGLKTLALRMERHSQNALTIARFLQAHPAVESVYYPGLENSPDFALAQRQMALPGGMLAFELVGGYSAGARFMNRLSMIKRAVSLGDAETLCQHPASMTHSTYTEQERASHGITDGLVRLSVGLEGCADIQADLAQALD
ncbi:MAG: methionine gamma-lyase [Saccharospirillum sp.]|nr:methionine gamma-lyase [Saccharospirillum sp.]